MHKKWTAAIAVMVLMQAAQAAPMAAQELPETHTMIGGENACRDVAPHRAHDTTWRSATRGICEAIKQTRQLVTNIAEHARTEGNDGDAAVQAAARLNEIRATCGQPCDDAYIEAMYALGSEDWENIHDVLLRAPVDLEVLQTHGYVKSTARAWQGSAPEVAATASIMVESEFLTHAPRATFGGRASGPIQRAEPGGADQVTLDTDTGAWPLARQRSAWGKEIPAEAVRPEEWVHYFEQGASTNEGPEPVVVRIETMPTPWNAQTTLVRVGLHARHDEVAETAPIALTWIMDRSGSMSPVQRFPMLTTALRHQIGKLPPGSSIAIAAYAAEVAVLLEPTADRAKALAVVERLRNEGTGGRTGGQAGVARAIALAQTHPEASRNVIVLATDGDFNIGASEPEDVEALAKRCRDAGSELHVILVGQDNVRDDIGQALAQAGNGRGYYADRLDEAHAILTSHLLRPPVGRDVKIRFEPNPARIAEYRRIGLETREITEDEFMDETTDGGELVAGDTASVWYELVPHDSSWRYLPGQTYGTQRVDPSAAEELGTVSVRFKTDEGPVELSAQIAGGEEATAHGRWLATVLRSAFKMRDETGSASDDWGTIYSEAIDTERTLGGTPAKRRARLELLDLLHLHANTS